MSVCLTASHQIIDKFKQCIVAIKAVAGFQEQTMTYTTPSLALKIGHALQELAKIVKRRATEQNDDARIKSADHVGQNSPFTIDLACGPYHSAALPRWLSFSNTALLLSSCGILCTFSISRCPVRAPGL